MASGTMQKSSIVVLRVSSSKTIAAGTGEVFSVSNTKPEGFNTLAAITLEQPNDYNLTPMYVTSVEENYIYIRVYNARTSAVTMGVRARLLYLP